MMRALAIYLGLLVLGIILAVAGWVLTPGAASFAFPGPINVAGQSLIALGLAFVVVAIGLLPPGAEERMMAAMEGPYAWAPGCLSARNQGAVWAPRGSLSLILGWQERAEEERGPATGT